MKKLFYFLSVTAALAFAAGCAKEADIDPVKGDLVETTFTVTLDDATATKAAIGNNADLINKLIVRAFKKSDGTSLKDLDGNFTIEDVETNSSNQKQFSVKAKLVRNFEYTIGFFAYHNGAPYAIDNDGVITMTPVAATKANDETLDAFYAAKDVKLDPETPSSLSVSVTLTRPLAQVNILSDPADWAAANTSGITANALQSSVTIAAAPNKLNLLDGSVDGEVDLAYALNAIPDGTVNVGTTAAPSNAKYIAMAYVLSDASGKNLNVTFNVPAISEVGFAGFTRTVNNMPAKRNYRTNLHGDLFTVSGDFTVTIDPTWGGNDDNQDINIPQPTVDPLSLPSGLSSTAVLPTFTGNNVATTVGDKDLFFGITTNSDGDITYTSTNTSVGTIENTGANAGLFHALAAGSTDIIIHQEAGTQTKAVDDPLADLTIVYHVTVEALEAAATPTFDPAAGAVPANTVVTIACATDGATIYYTVDGSDPTTASTAYSEAITIDSGKIIKAIAVKEGMANSEIATAEYTIMGVVATPVLSPGTSYFTSGDKVTITCSTEGASIYYTTNGDTPSASSTPYSAPVDIVAGPFKAIAIKEGMVASEIAEATYTAKLSTSIVLADQNMTFGGEKLTLAPVLKAGEVTVSEGVSFSYTAGDEKVTVSGAEVTAVSAGSSSVKINATVPDAYLAPAEKTVAITIAKASSSISWKDGDLALTVGGATLDLKDQYTKSGSEGAVSFAITEGDAYATLSNGVLTAVAAGTVKVKATLEGDANYDGAETAEKAVTVNAAAAPKSDQTLSFDKEELEFAYGASYTLPVLSGAQTSVTYSIEDVSPTGAISVDASTGALTVTKAGAGMVYARAAESETYNAGEAFYVVTVSKAAQTLSFGATTEFEISYGDDFTEPTLSGAQTTVTYSIETVNGNVTINSSTGALTISGADIVTVTATAATDDIYETASVSYELTINAAVPPTPSVYAVTIDSGITGGTITANPNTNVAAGTTVNLTVTPTNSDDRLKPGTLTYKINGEGEGVAISNNSFVMPSGDVTIYAEFEYKYEWVSTAITSLSSNDIIVIVSTKESSSYALSSESVNNKGNKAVSITYSSNKLSGIPDSKLIWVITVNTDDVVKQYEFTTSSSSGTETPQKWYCTSDNNGLRVGTTNIENGTKFTLTDNYLKNVAQNRYVGVYNGTDWRSYTSINSNISEQSFSFFKKTEKQ